MFQFFTSFGASSNFEKYRLEITAKTYEAPNEQSLRYVVNAFGGQDPETKSQIAYATIVKKLLTSDSKNNWLYLLKNLIIFDRVCQENLFTEEISAVSIPTIDQFKESDQKYMLLDTQRLLKGYWRLIKEKSNILASRKHIFCFKRGQRMQYLSKLTAAETLKQIQSIETFFAMTYDLIDILSGKKMIDEATVQTDKIVRAREQFGKSRLLEYLYLHIMHKLMQYYSCQLQCNNYFLQIIIKRSQELRDEEIRKYRKNIIKFKQNSNDYIKFVEERKQIKGFEELNYKELNPFQSEDIVKTIDLLLAAKTHDSSVHESIQYIFGESKMSVQKKPLNDMNKDQLIPRLKMAVRKSQQSMKDLKMERVESEQETNSFLNYNNSYSSEFPQKEIMTVDLIMQLKEQDKENNDEMIELQSSVRDFCNYNDRDTNVSTNFQLSYQYCRENGEHTLNFHSIFSGNPKHWNS